MQVLMGDAAERLQYPPCISMAKSASASLPSLAPVQVTYLSRYHAKYPGNTPSLHPVGVLGDVPGDVPKLRTL